MQCCWQLPQPVVFLLWKRVAKLMCFQSYILYGPPIIGNCRNGQNKTWTKRTRKHANQFAEVAKIKRERKKVDFALSHFFIVRRI